MVRRWSIRVACEEEAGSEGTLNPRKAMQGRLAVLDNDLCRWWGLRVRFGSVSQRRAGSGRRLEHVYQLRRQACGEAELSKEKPLKKQRSEVPVKGLMLYQDHSKVERKSKSEVS